ncbi:substrate-binding domain-containing protein [Bordetella genomosp. 13]|uniref:substrate-binding domain-containing protein n=1 Tax=Bordetella genomosp. 13 TaxID=463040 RepID=UPI0018E04CA4|nr:substrate-binding domain-containing protein [Bordetella genomosp. 13]
MKSVFKMKMLSAVVAAGLMMGAGAASAQVVGGGATLPEVLYNDLFTSFEDYIGVGSGAGKRAFFNNNPAEFGLPTGTTVDYAGSDSLVSSTEANNYATNNEAAFGPLIQIPSVLTSVTVPYNVSGVTNLNLTSEQLAGIFSGRITNWSDVGGPNQPITVVYRPDGSGTTEIFARHLNNRSASDFPSVSNVFWTALGLPNQAALPSNFVAGDSLGTTGSAGIVEVVDATPYSIGYVSPDFVNESSNAEVARVNGVLPTPANVQTAVGTLAPPSPANRANPLAWGISIANPASGYSIVASTNLILSQCYVSTQDTSDIRDMLATLYGTAGTWDAAIGTHGFVPLPANWKTAVRQTFVDQSNSLELAVGHPTECANRGRPQ